MPLEQLEVVNDSSLCHLDGLIEDIPHLLIRNVLD